MQQLSNKRIVLGVTGGIAAYKSADLVRRLREAGAEVRVVMTKAGIEFITPLTMQALSGYPVHTDLLDPAAEAAMGHIELARWADAVIVAPATADFMARLAHGQADDLLTTLCLATAAPIVLAPAMNQGMWKDAATQHNKDILLKKQVMLLGPAEGSQACGDVGLGRMLEPQDIIEQVTQLFKTDILTGVTVLITAGPTQEAIDPVRFISNHSSGKMGYALAEAAVAAGAKVILVSGPTHLDCPERVQRINVVSAQDMLEAVMQNIPKTQIFIATAAVADYRPVDVATQKIKKHQDQVQFTLIKNPDILKTVAELPGRPFLVGFAAETQELEKHAQEKLSKKKLDMIAANPVNRADIGFHSEDNELTLYWKNGKKHLDKASKKQIARQLLQIICQLSHEALIKRLSYAKPGKIFTRDELNER